MNQNEKENLPGIIIIAFALIISSCDKETTQPDQPPVITQYQPIQLLLSKSINDTITFGITETDEDGDAVNYKFLKDNVEVSSTNKYEWIVDKKGTTVVEGIAYNELADTVKWTVNIGDRFPIAIAKDTTATIDSPVSLDGSQSTHPDTPLNEILEYQWQQLSGTEVVINNSDSSIARFTPITAGEYEFILTVRDNLDQEDKDTLTATIESYLLTVNTINVLNDEPIDNLEVMFAGNVFD